MHIGNQSEPSLHDAVSWLAQTDLMIIADVLHTYWENSGLKFKDEPADLAIIINCAVKAALMLNRVPPHDACEHMRLAVQKMFSCP